MAAKYVISIDPGAVHCGVAIWEKDFFWRCSSAIELPPNGCADEVRERLDCDDVEKVICENYTERPGHHPSGTIEMIGVLRHLCRWNAVEFKLIQANATKATRRRLKAAGYKFKAHGHGTHAADAESVGAAGMKLSVKDLIEAG